MVYNCNYSCVPTLNFKKFNLETIRRNSSFLRPHKSFFDEMSRGSVSARGEFRWHHAVSRGRGNECMDVYSDQLVQNNSGEHVTTGGKWHGSQAYFILLFFLAFFFLKFSVLSTISNKQRRSHCWANELPIQNIQFVAFILSIDFSVTLKYYLTESAELCYILLRIWFLCKVQLPYHTISWTQVNENFFSFKISCQCCDKYWKFSSEQLSIECFQIPLSSIKVE